MKVSNILISTTASLAVVYSQACPDYPTTCVNDLYLAVCTNGSWSTEACGDSDYCMTMMPGMVHCMKRPPNFTPNTDISGASGSQTATQASDTWIMTSDTWIMPSDMNMADGSSSAAASSSSAAASSSVAATSSSVASSSSAAASSSAASSSSSQSGSSSSSRSASASTSSSTTQSGDSPVLKGSMLIGAFASAVAIIFSLI
ncbi:hypothetical protein AYI68_g2138 [Smittium mucronatum]|uniref:Uncharacterized protein n=1 Tax=Smittium mucronatum TaxID=133383 RepID=A0A1R0H3Q7_9FUNG|nr:hypothetical protein AYI68_g2138 [Smittium mucronatum]